MNKSIISRAFSFSPGVCALMYSNHLDVAIIAHLRYCFLVVCGSNTRAFGKSY